MFLIFIYAPFLIFAPLLLLLGILFVVGAAGFSIMLGGAYVVFDGLIGLLGIAVRDRLRKNRAQTRLEPKARLSTARISRPAHRT